MPKVAFPARCAVALICGEHLVSQVFPAAVPVEVFIDNVVELVNDELKRRGVPALLPDTSYQLHRANGVRIDITKTLDELGVEDGASLVLASADPGDSFEPHYESLSTGLARIGEKLFEPVSVATATRATLAILAGAAAVLLGLALRSRLATDSLLPSAVTGGAGLLVAAGGTATLRWWPKKHDLIAGFGWLATPLLATGFAMAAPGRLGSAHGFIAALAIAVLAGGMAAVTRRYLTGATVVVTLCVLSGTVATARMWQPVPVQWLGMGTLTALLLMLTMAPTIALWVARIRPPHFGSITGRDLFRRSDGLPADAVAPVDVDNTTDDETKLDTTPRGAWIAAAAKRANSVLTGVCVAAGLALPAAVWATVLPARGLATGVLVGLFVIIFISRGRAFADKHQSVALVLGAAAAVCVGVVKYVVNQPADDGGTLVGAALVLTGFGGAGVLAALLVPITKFTPLVRMAAEWIELLAIVAALPLAAWIGGLFTWVRLR